MLENALKMAFLTAVEHRAAYYGRGIWDSGGAERRLKQMKTGVKTPLIQEGKQVKVGVERT